MFADPRLRGRRRFAPVEELSCRAVSAVLGTGVLLVVLATVLVITIATLQGGPSLTPPTPTPSPTPTPAPGPIVQPPAPALAEVPTLCVAEVPHCPSVVLDLLPAAQARAQELRDIADGMASVDWATYSAAPVTHAGKRVLVTQADFASGTLRLTTPVYLQFAEDIVFDPNPGADHNPMANQTEYASEAYTLGFFAAITIEAPNVTIDGQGHMFTQSMAHYLQQRFFALIELGDRPFIPPQGPADFGPTFTRAEYGVVRDLHFGLSSHHAIHGNFPDHMYLVDLHMADYEVAALSLNAPTYLVQERLVATGNLQRIPVDATYSHARFLKPLVHTLLTQFDTNATVTDDLNPGQLNQANQRAALLSAAMADLNTLMDEAYEDLVTNMLPAIDNSTHPEAYALFANPGNVGGGSAYGFLYHGRGVAVNGFLCDPTSVAAQASFDTLLVDSRVLNTWANTTEVVALAYCPDGIGNATYGYIPCETQIGPIGEVIRIADLADPVTGYYTGGNALFEVQVQIARLMKSVPLLAVYSTTLKMRSEVWSFWDGSVSVTDMLGSGEWTYQRNGDAMFHVGKGTMGIRLDGGGNHCMDNVTIDGVTNVGLRSKTAPLPGEAYYGAGGLQDPYYTGYADGGHPLQFPLAGYPGCHSRGMSVTAAYNLYFEDVVVHNVTSRHGWARGVDYFHGSESVFEHGLTISQVLAPWPDGQAELAPYQHVGPIVRGAWGHAASTIADAARLANMTTVTMGEPCSPGIEAQCLARAVYPEPDTAERCTPSASPGSCAVSTNDHSLARSLGCPYAAYNAHRSECPFAGTA